jgi:hypothetical protein
MTVVGIQKWVRRAQSRKGSGMTLYLDKKIDIHDRQYLLPSLATTDR